MRNRETSTTITGGERLVVYYRIYIFGVERIKNKTKISGMFVCGKRLYIEVVNILYGSAGGVGWVRVSSPFSSLGRM
jgi:hypothetical protein